MKRHIFILGILSALLMVSCKSKQDSPKASDDFKGHRPPAVEELISDLSNDQKKQIQDITQAMMLRKDSLRAEQKQVRDSINYYNDLYGDYSAKVDTLYDREAAIQAEINKEFYRNKVLIDQVLTKEQWESFITQMKKYREDHPHHKHGKDSVDRPEKRHGGPDGPHFDDDPMMH